MVSTIRPKSYKRYLSLPILGPIVDEFIAWSSRRGYAVSTMQGQLAVMRQLDDSFRRFGLRGLTDLTYVHFENGRLCFRKRWPFAGGVIRQLELFLKETGRLAPRPSVPATLAISEANRFRDYLRRVRGLAPGTILSHTRYLKRFLHRLDYDSDADILGRLTMKEVEDFLCVCAQTLNRYTLQHVVAFLRAFLRYQHERGVLLKPLHTMIDTPRVYRLEQLPRSLSWKTVNELLESIDQADVNGMRDYAMLYLIAAYGLRTCEVSSLTLDDIHWRAGVISIRQGKTRNHLSLPLTDAAASVLIKYLERRPKLPYRELFLRIRAPHGPLKPTAVTEVFQHWARRSGLNIPFQGPHCIRHSYAVHLLREGVSVKAIGDLMGHRNAESTCAYLRLALEDLRSVALPVPLETSPVSIPKAKCLSVNKERKVMPPNRAPLRSVLAEEIKDYLRLKRSLGRDFGNETNTLRSLDAFLAKHCPSSRDLTGEAFSQWCATLGHLSPTVRRNRMRVVRNFCLYRRRSRPQAFLPDRGSFPANHQPSPPYIVTEPDMARILESARSLPRFALCPLRPETLRIAFLLLFTTGMRRGELLRLTLGDIDLTEETISVRETKFHKSRIIPLSPSVAAETKAYLELRQKNHLPMSVASPLALSGSRSAEGRGYTGHGLACNWITLCASLNINTPKGRPPRIHDVRHSFAVNVLMEWYHNGENVQAKLPLLSTYMGHVSVVSTHYYLTFVEGLRSEASTLFHRCFGDAVKANHGDAR